MRRPLRLGSDVFAFGETVTVLTAGSVFDPYSGESTPSWDESPTGVEVPGVGVAQGGSIESPEVARESVESDFDLIFPPDAVVAAANRVVVRGLVCEVAGRPFLWRNPFTGWTPGLVVRAKIKEG